MALLVAVSALLTACGGGDSDKTAGLTRADVEEIVRAEMAKAPAPAQPEPGLSKSEVDAMVRAAIASVPPKSAPAEYTQFVVDGAIARYETQGLEATLAHYNRAESVDGQWYVFIIDDNDLVIAHPDPDRRGLDVKGWVGTDANGYNFGPEMLSATPAGKWVGYVYRNPASGRIGEDSAGDFELKNAWVVRHDGLLFGSGWYIDIDEFITTLTDDIAQRLRSSGLEATIAHYSDPQNLAEGLQGAIAYYNTTATADGTWVGFYADLDGTVLFHNDLAAIGTNIADQLGPAVLAAPAQAAWITEADNPDGQGPQSMRIRAFNQDGIIFGTGWYQTQN